MKKQLKKEFDKRVKTLNLNKQAKEELLAKFVKALKNGFTCAYCGNKMELKWGSEISFTFDHSIPRKRGGKDTVENIEVVCRTCNFLKGDMSVEKYIQNMGRLIVRKNKKEYWKAKKSSKNDEQTREAFKDIFQHINAKEGRK